VVCIRGHGKRMAMQRSSTPGDACWHNRIKARRCCWPNAIAVNRRR